MYRASDLWVWYDNIVLKKGHHEIVTALTKAGAHNASAVHADQAGAPATADENTSADLNSPLVCDACIIAWKEREYSDFFWQFDNIIVKL